MIVCERCIEISCIEYRGLFPRPKKYFPNKIQCEGCGAWWELKQPKTIRFIFNKYNATWCKTNYSFLWAYLPMVCSQRKCKEHARHKVKTRGKRKYKCDKHAGVCIIV